MERAARFSCSRRIELPRGTVPPMRTDNAKDSIQSGRRQASRAQAYSQRQRPRSRRRPRPSASNGSTWLTSRDKSWQRVRETPRSRCQLTNVARGYGRPPLRSLNREVWITLGAHFGHIEALHLRFTGDTQGRDQVAHLEPDKGHGKPEDRDNARYGANHHGRPGLDEGAGRGDGHQTSQHAVTHHGGIWL